MTSTGRKALFYGLEQNNIRLSTLVVCLECPNNTENYSGASATKYAAAYDLSTKCSFCKHSVSRGCKKCLSHIVNIYMISDRLKYLVILRYVHKVKWLYFLN
jgi:lipoate synthase